jgi:hypothetical protein
MSCYQPWYLPFGRANSYDCPEWSAQGQIQTCYRNDFGAIDPRRNVWAFAVASDAQRLGLPLEAPFDPPAYQCCGDKGPRRVDGRDYCVTNVVSRPAGTPPPPCARGLVPLAVGTSDAQGIPGGGARTQWQCVRAGPQPCNVPCPATAYPGCSMWRQTDWATLRTT